MACWGAATPAATSGSSHALLPVAPLPPSSMVGVQQRPHQCLSRCRMGVPYHSSSIGGQVLKQTATRMTARKLPHVVLQQHMIICCSSMQQMGSRWASHSRCHLPPCPSASG